MRVGILSQWFSPETGPASIPGVLARGLVERGHEVTVLTGYPNYPTGVLYDGFSMKTREDRFEHGYAIRRVALYPDHSTRISGRLLNYGSFAASAAAFGTSALKGIDVLWVYNSPATVALPMWLTKVRFRTPIVLHNMDMWPDSVIRTGFTPKRGSRPAIHALNAWVNAMYASATTVAYVTPAAGDELRRRGIPDEKLRYAPVWVDESVFRPADGSLLRRQLGFGVDDVVVGYAGALGRAQSVVELAQAVASLPESSPVKCLILGSGTEAGQLAHIAAERPDRVRYLGQVPHSDMTEYSAVPDISFVGLSPDGQEAFAAPSKIPAIMACAKPMLAAVAGDSAALVHASGAGVVVSPGDASALSEGLLQIGGAGRDVLHEQGRRARRFYVGELSESKNIGRVARILDLARRAPRVPSR